MENNQSSFWQFSDQLRGQNSLSNLSLSDSIWSNSYASKRTDDRRNFDLKVGGEINSSNSFSSNLKSDFNGFSNDGRRDVNNSGFKSDFNGISNDTWKEVNNSGFNSDFNGFSNDSWKDVNNSGFNSDVNGLVNGGWNGLTNSGFKSGVNVYSNSGFKSNFDGFSNDGWKDVNNSGFRSYGPSKSVADVGGMGFNGGFNKNIYSNSSPFGYERGNNNVVVNGKMHIGKGAKGGEIYEHGIGAGGKNGKKNKSNKENNKEGNHNNGDSKNSLDKRFKTLPPSESLPRNEIVGGYIFVCNNDTMQENLKRQLFGLPPRYRDSVRAITPGLPVFLYNYSTHQLHGIFEAASFGGTNIDPTAWEDKKNPGESRFPAQVAVMTRKSCEPLEEDSFRPILHHYDGPKFRLELSVPEALSLLDIFHEHNA